MIRIKKKMRKSFVIIIYSIYLRKIIYVQTRTASHPYRIPEFIEVTLEIRISTKIYRSLTYEKNHDQFESIKRYPGY